MLAELVPKRYYFLRFSDLAVPRKANNNHRLWVHIEKNIINFDSYILKDKKYHSGSSSNQLIVYNNHGLSSEGNSPIPKFNEQYTEKQ